MTIGFNAWMAAIACCVLAAPTMAATDEGEDQIDSYVSVNGGQANEKNGCLSPANPQSVPCTEKYYAYRLAYGYQFTPAWGLEVSYGDLGYAESKGVAVFTSVFTGLPVASNYTWSLKSVGWAIGGTGTIHLGKYIALFGKAGLVRPEFREERIRYETGGWIHLVGAVNAAYTHPTYGAGIDVNFTPNFSLRAQYEDFGSYDIYSYYGITTVPKVKLTMASAGLVFRF